MKKPKIGFKTANLFYDGPGKIDFRVLEITTKDPKITFNVKKILNVKKEIKGKEVSMHTQTSRIFSCNDLKIGKFNSAELEMLRAEIILCNILGIKELIIHLKQNKLTRKEASLFRNILKFAKKNKVEIIYESNGYFKAETCFDVLKKFPKLNYNLDMGHLNTAIVNKSLGIELDKIKKRTVYVHAHNNKGADEHKGINEGTLDWEYVLDRLDHSKVRKIIMEVRGDPKVIKKSKSLLDKYIDKKW